MDTRFSPRDLAFQDEVRAFIAATFPAARPYRGTTEDKAAFVRALKARGWVAYKWPREHGGTGWSVTERFIWERETFAAGLPQGPGGMGLAMIGPILYTYGTDDQKRRHLPPILENSVHWCQGYSEPGSGSDLASLRTRASRDGDHYVITGEKVWTSDAHLADWMFCLTRTSSEGRPQEGITFLLIDMRTKGIAVTPIISIDGLHTLNRVTFDEVRVPVANRIGAENKGWTYAKGLLEHERSGLAFIAMTIHMLRELKEAAAALGAGGERLLDDPAFRRKIAETEAEVLALEYTELRTLSETAIGAAPGKQSSVLKLEGTRLVQRATELFVEAAGYYGGVWGYPKEEALLSNSGSIGPDWVPKNIVTYYKGRSASIAGGTDEVQKNIIAKHVLGL